MTGTMTPRKPYHRHPLTEENMLPQERARESEETAETKIHTHVLFWNFQTVAASSTEVATFPS
jgi:hypothetical protein